MRHLCAVLLAGCGVPTLEGSWSSEEDWMCLYSDELEVEIELDEDGSRSYEGTGEAYWSVAGVPWGLAFEVTIEHRGRRGAFERIVDLDVDLDDCVEMDLGEVDCPDIDSAVYNAGMDAMGFYNVGLFEDEDCSGSLEP